MSSGNSKRIAKNTILLYFRMLLTMIVSLYTVRVVLATLGVIDYGIYNVVGGIVAMFSFLSGTMASASQRFFAFELGKGNYSSVRQTFSLTLTSYIGVALIIFIFAETLGLWFLNTYLTIPGDRIEAANWVYQFSIFSFIITILTIPYNALIIAHERMNIYAIVSILEVVLKLLIVYLLVYFSFDKLKLYSVLTFCVITSVSLIYRMYCNRKFRESHYFFFWDKYRFKELISFAWWNMLGSIAMILKNQGGNILLNIFFGPVVNAARGVAYQVNMAISSFMNNFYMAVRPAITKTYAEGNTDRMFKLMFQSTKFSYFLMLVFAFPILFETHYVLSLWLNNIPDHVVLFTRLVIIDSIFEVFNNPIAACVQAKGNLKNYQLVISSILLLNIPLAYFLFKEGFPPQSIFYVAIGLSAICYFVRLLLIRRLLTFPVKKYLNSVLFKCVIITILVLVLPCILIYNLEESMGRLILIILSCLILSIIMFYHIGLSDTERYLLLNFVKTRFGKYLNKIN